MPRMTRIENFSMSLWLWGCLGIKFSFLSLKGAYRDGETGMGESGDLDLSGHCPLEAAYKSLHGKIQEEFFYFTAKINM